MKIFRIFPIIIAAAVLFASCEVEFSPNDNWKDIPIVYCLLDQDDDTTYVRVQRCFMGEGNQLQYAQIGDSINYPQGAITVIMEEWKTQRDNDGTYRVTGSAPIKVYNFEYGVMSNKDSGMFYSEGQPIYKSYTKGMFDTASLYRLKVIKNATGDTIAKSETMLVRGNMMLKKPNISFDFVGAQGNRTCDLEWTSLTNARQYQPIVRFWYYNLYIDESVTPHDSTFERNYVDIKCNVVKSNMREALYNTKLEESKFLANIKTALKDEECKRFIIDTVYIYIVSCTEDLAAYLYASNPLNSLSQDPFTYTNIDGGLGVFAARRQHIFFKMKTPSAPASNYIKQLKALDVGF